MSKLVYNNHSIECLSANVIARKIMPGPYVKYPKVGKCLVYKCSRNSEAVILKELTPKNPLVNKFSNLDLHTKIECERLYVAIKRVKPYKKFGLINHTGTHKAQNFETDEFTYAKITLQLSNLQEAKPLIAIEEYL